MSNFFVVGVANIRPFALCIEQFAKYTMLSIMIETIPTKVASDSLTAFSLSSSMFCDSENKHTC